MKITDIKRWEIEIDLAEKWRDDNFGKFSSGDRSGAGYLIDYFDRGYGSNVSSMTGEPVVTTLNIVHSVVKTVVPSLWYQNPKVLVFPKKAGSQDTAPIVGQILNHYYKELDLDHVNQRIVWDAYVLGHGYYKIGYATKFGTDIDDPKKPKTLKDRALELVGLKEPKKEEVVHPDINYEIVSGSPYVMYISPFDFGRDPRANSLEDSMYWYHKVRRTVKQMKFNKKYKNTSDLVGEEPEDMKIGNQDMAQSEIDDFRTVMVYEIHYRNQNKNYILVISKDGKDHREHYHEESIYEMEGWQCDELTFNKHNHQPFAISDISKITPLQDRFTSTIDTILEQVDRFVPKIACNENDVTEEGKAALENGDIGSIVWTTKNPAEVVRELSFTQLKGDLKALSEQMIDIVSIQTGITRTQLTGLSNADSATEATIAQGGQTLRISDMNRAVNRFARRQAKKLWEVVKQFVDLEELELINGETGVDETGMPLYNWLTVDVNKSEKMKVGEYDFDIEVGSTQKPDLAVVRKQFENLFSILARTDVIALMQQQGDKIVLSELLRMYLNLFPEAVKDIGRIIQKINANTTGLIAPPPDKGGGTTPGSNFNAMESMAGQAVPGMPREINMGVNQ